MDQWNSISDFFYMSGYGQYVWGTYGMILFCFICELVGLIKRRRRAARELALEARARQAEERI